MIPRRITRKLQQSVRDYPVVTVTGPRQSGKTTLVRSVFKQYDYVSLENPEQRALCLDDPIGFLRHFKGPVILDEVQRTPDIFSYIQGIVDEKDKPGQFILTGSQNFLFLETVTQTLAGRCAVLHLHPFSFDELNGRKGIELSKLGNTCKRTEYSPSENLCDVLFTGFYPRIHDKGLDPQDWLGNYFQTYLERDLRNVVNVGDSEVFRRFVRLCAGRNGSLLNMSSIASDCGISHTNVRRWISVLESSFLVTLLRPHHRNFRKRLIKSPKLYFLDTGFLCYLLGIRSPEELSLHAMRGAVFESFVISESIKKRADAGKEADIYFWRDSAGHEIDMLIEEGKELIPAEIKSGETFNRDFLKGIQYWKNISDKPDTPAAVIYGGDTSFMHQNTAIRSWMEI